MREDLLQLVGLVGETISLELEKGAVRKYADATGDSNPRYWDEEYARQSGTGKIVAPPGFFGWPARWQEAGPLYTSLWRQLTDVTGRLGYRRGLVGRVEHDFYRAISVGETILATPRIQDVYERDGRNGKLLFIVVETTYVDESGRLVAKVRETLIRR